MLLSWRWMYEHNFETCLISMQSAKTRPKCAVFPADKASLRTWLHSFTDPGIQHRISNNFFLSGSSAARSLGFSFAWRLGMPLATNAGVFGSIPPCGCPHYYAMGRLHSESIAIKFVAGVVTRTVPDEPSARPPLHGSQDQMRCNKAYRGDEEDLHFRRMRSPLRCRLPQLRCPIFMGGSNLPDSFAPLPDGGFLLLAFHQLPHFRPDVTRPCCPLWSSHPTANELISFGWRSNLSLLVSPNPEVGNILCRRRRRTKSLMDVFNIIEIGLHAARDVDGWLGQRRRITPRNRDV